MLTSFSSRGSTLRSSGCSEVETLGHVLGYCLEGELLRNNGHHKVRSSIATTLRKAKWKVYQEMHCLAENGKQKPFVHLLRKQLSMKMAAASQDMQDDRSFHSDKSKVISEIDTGDSDYRPEVVQETASEYEAGFEQESLSYQSGVKKALKSATRVGFSATTILDKTSGYWDLVIKEAIEIQLDGKNFNRDGGLQLSTAWKPAINTLRPPAHGRQSGPASSS
ncbi:hypothetical protein ANN_16996 [Periplaneta americana]|uniref:Uncharacterized protein n=1 Tax=Periplaneta americana TaxID=6978 RepID=A0ABQ8SSR9_PERAM|nr:hypothetical protein ANN_16996 [Periplaneta americana]